MKSKTFIILFIFFCILAGVAYFLFTGGKSRQEQMHQTLFQDLPIEKIARIDVLSSDGAVHLARKQSGWVVENRFDYLADFSLIMDLVSEIQTARIGRSFAASPDSVMRLGLHLPDAANVDPEKKGVRIIFKNKEDGVLADAILGKTREMTAGAGGHYIMPGQGQKIYLVDKKFDDIGKKDADWIQKEVTDIQEQEIESVVCRPLDQQKAIYTLKRPGKEKQPVLQDMPEAPPLDPSKINDVFTALAPLTIEDVAGVANGPSESEIDFVFLFEYRLFDHSVYSIFPGRGKIKDKPKYYLKISAHLKEEDTSGTMPKETKGTQDIKQGQRRTDPLIHNWIYEIPEWKFKRFIDNLPDLYSKSD